MGETGGNRVVPVAAVAGWRAAVTGWRAAVAGWRAAMISPRRWRPAEQVCWQRLLPELFAGPAARRGPGHLLLQVWVLDNNIACLRNRILFVQIVLPPDPHTRYRILASRFAFDITIEKFRLNQGISLVSDGFRINDIL
jgi:hypothetical protein